MNSHIFPEGDVYSVRCVHCGTRASQTERTACPGGAPVVSGLRPEPAERSYAVESWDAIYAGIARLRTEREAIWSTVEDESQTA